MLINPGIAAASQAETLEISTLQKWYIQSLGNDQKRIGLGVGRLLNTNPLNDFHIAHDSKGCF